MNIINYLKKIKVKLLNEKVQNDNIFKDYNVDNIEIIIENYNNMFGNEHEIIKNGAITLLESAYVDNIEEGIIVFATMIRGLKYNRTEKDNTGRVKIILQDIKLEKTMTKKI